MCVFENHKHTIIIISVSCIQNEPKWTKWTQKHRKSNLFQEGSKTRPFRLVIDNLEHLPEKPMIFAKDW